MLSLSTAVYSETRWAGSSTLILIYLGWYLGVICTLSAPISADASEEWLISRFQKCKCCICPCSRDLVDLNNQLMVVGESHILTGWIHAAVHFDAQGDFRLGRASKGKCLSKDISLSSPWRKWGGGSKGAATSYWWWPTDVSLLSDRPPGTMMMLSAQNIPFWAAKQSVEWLWIHSILQLKSHTPSCWRILP